VLTQVRGVPRFSCHTETVSSVVIYSLSRLFLPPSISLCLFPSLSVSVSLSLSVSLCLSVCLSVSLSVSLVSLAARQEETRWLELSLLAISARGHVASIQSVSRRATTTSESEAVAEEALI